MNHYFDTVTNAATGLPFSGVTVRVLNSAGSLATIYSDNGGTAVTTPGQVTTGADGFFEFYVADGPLTIEYLYGGSLVKRITNVILAERPMIGLLSALGSITIASDVNIITTSGYAVAGRGAATYVRDGTSALSTRGTVIRDAAVAGGVVLATATAAVAATEAYFRRVDAGGNYWTLYKDQRIESKMFGAVHDAVGSGSRVWNVQWSGTDDRASIQAMLDWAGYWQNKLDVYLSPGRFLIGDTLHIGYGFLFAGVSYVSTCLRGSGFGLYGSVGNPETTLVRNFCGRPAINVGGGRGVIIDQFSTYGASGNYYEDNGFSHSLWIPGVGLATTYPGATQTINDTLAASWDNPAITTALGRSQDHRYCPDAAIVIDAYAGTAPATPYPATTYPGWFAPGSAQYGKNYTSSRVDIAPTGMAFKGETNIVVACPSGTIDQNTDYINIGRITVNNCKRIASVGHTQMHGFNIDYAHCEFVYECLTGNAHGYQTGHFDGHIRNFSANSIIQLFSVGSTVSSGALTFHSPYIENGYRIAQVEGGFGWEPPIHIVQATMGFDLQSDWRGQPAYMIGKAASAAIANVPVVIDGGFYHQFRGAFNVLADVSVRGGAVFDPRNTGGEISSATALPEYLSTFHNGTAGGYVMASQLLSLTQRGRPHDSRYWMRSLATGLTSGFGAVSCSERHRFCTRDLLLPFWAPSAMPHQGKVTEAIPNPQRREQYDKTGFTSVSTEGAGTGFTWTFTNPAASDLVERYGGATGDILFDADSGIVFVVQSYTKATGVTKARALTGVKRVSGTWVTIPTFSGAAGTLYAACVRNFLHPYGAFATFTAASANATAVNRDDGGVLGTEIAVTDRIDADDYTDNFAAPASTNITAYDSAAKTLTLGGNALVTGKRRLTRFIRTNIANVA
jgi:hypothetical protein